MEKAVEAVGEEFARNSQMYLGHRGHMLTFPIEKGDTMNVVAFQRKRDGKWENDQWVLPMKKEDMFSDFEGWGDSVKRILSVRLAHCNLCFEASTDKIPAYGEARCLGSVRSSSSTNIL